MRWKRAAAAAWLVVLALPATAVAPGAVAGLQPQSLEPLSFTVPFVYRTMEGLQTNLIEPPVTYDHLHAVAFAPDGHMALAVGSHNTLVQYDPVLNRTTILRNGTLGNLYGVGWSDDSSVALAVGYGGTLIEVGDGTITDLPPEGSTTWQGAAFVPGAGFLVVGDGGAAFFLNGTTRTAVNTSTTNDLMAVAYSGVLGLALVVGRAGTAMTVSAAGAVSPVSAPTGEDLRSVGFEADTGKGLVAGGNGVLLAFQAGALSNETHAPLNAGFYDIAVTRSTEPAVIAARNGSLGYIDFTNASFDQTVALGSVFSGVEAVSRSPTQGFVVGTGFFGLFVRAYQNGSWENISQPYRPVITDAAWRPAGDLALLVGFNGTVTLFNRLTNQTTSIVGPNTTASLRGVSWAENGSEALIVGAYALWRFDVGALNITEPVASPPDLYGVAFRPGGTDALLVGAAGYIGVWSGGALTPVNSTVVQGLFTVRWHTTSGVGDYAYAAGANVVARYTPPSTVQGVVRIGTFFGVAFQGDDVWVVGSSHQIQRYDAANGIWDNVSLPWAYNTTRFSRVVERPNGEGLLFVGNQSFSGYLNLSKVLRFDTGFLADFNGVAYNPVTQEPLFFGPGRLAFSMREGIIPNLPPIAQITSPADGSNWTDVDTIRFDASTSSDYDDDPLTFSWFDSASGFLTNGATLNTQLPAGNHTLTVFVDDGHGHNVSAAVNVSVSVMQFAPTAVIASPAASDTPSDEDVITFSAAGSFDRNNDIVSYSWASDRIGPFGNGSILALTLPAGTHLITLTVTDSTGRSANASVLLAVHVADQPPLPTVVSPNANVTYASNLPVVLNASGTTDPDSTALSYVWLDEGAQIATGAYNTTFLTAGRHNITLEVSDGKKTARYTVNVDVGGPANLPPRFLSVSPPNGTVLTGSVVLNGTVDIDVVGPVLFIEVKVGDSPFQHASGTVTWTFNLDTTQYANGDVTVTYRAFDGLYEAVENRTYRIDNPVVNSPPTVSILTPHPGASISTPTEMAGSVDDLDSAAATVEYRVSGGAWTPANVSGSTWSVPIDPAALPAGPTLFEVRAFDGQNYSAVSAVTVTIVHPTAPPSGFDDTVLAVAVVAIGAVAAIALVVWRRSRA